MTPKPLSDLSPEELYKQKTTYKSTVITLLVFACILLLLNIYFLLFKEPNFALLSIMACQIPIGLPAYTALKKVNEELKNRS
jgi:hypothetical protein